MQLPPFELERYFAQYEFSVPYLLCGSDCEAMSARELLDLEEGSRERLERCWLGYTESQGSPELRREIAALYSEVEPQHVLVHAGAEEAIFTFMTTQLSSGDHAVVHAPAYQSLYQIALSRGCEVSFWTGSEEAGWELDLESLKDLLRPNTRVIVINCPHNPTGYLMRPAPWRELLQLADRRGIVVFSDEVYRLTEYDSVPPLPAACDLSPSAVSLGVLSKAFGLPGLRIGWIATRNKRILREMAQLKDYLSICNSAPSECLAAIALRQRDPLLRRVHSILAENLRHLDAFFSRTRDHLAWQRPVAGPIAFPRLRRGSADQFCRTLVETTGVLLLPSSRFAFGDSHFRLAFGRRNLPTALERLEEFLTTWRGEDS